MRKTGVVLVILGLLASTGLALVIRAVLGSAGVLPSGDQDTDAPNAHTKGKFTISKETTHITGPLDKDGYVDYVAALNERLREGVTPENNANVLLWKAFGPHPEGPTVPAEFFKALGVDPPPQNGKYVIPWSQHLRKHLEVDPGGKVDLPRQVRAARQGPWKAADSACIAGWLTANETPLALVVEASKRSHYFAPVVPSTTGKEPAGLAFASSALGAQPCGELASLLQTRAMLHMGEGRWDEAWQDIMAYHRLARLVARGGSLFRGLLGAGFEARAVQADMVFFERAKLDAKRIKNCLRDLQSLPPLPAPTDSFDLCERFIVLETVMMLDRHGVAHLDRVLRGGPPKPRPLAKGLFDNLDWDPVLRDLNRWFDRIVAACRAKEHAARIKQLEELAADLETRRKEPLDVDDLVQRLVDAGPNRGKVLTDYLISGTALESVGGIYDNFDRFEQMRRNVEVAFALAAYQREHGRYPKALDALAPNYLREVPLDLFSGKALIYRPSDNGYLLYSVGPNGRDDGGRAREDNPPGDDIRVRMSLLSRSWNEEFFSGR